MTLNEHKTQKCFCFSNTDVKEFGPIRAHRGKKFEYNIILRIRSQCGFDGKIFCTFTRRRRGFIADTVSSFTHRWRRSLYAAMGATMCCHGKFVEHKCLRSISSSFVSFVSLSFVFFLFCREL